MAFAARCQFGGGRKADTPRHIVTASRARPKATAATIVSWTAVAERVRRHRFRLQPSPPLPPPAWLQPETCLEMVSTVKAVRKSPIPYRKSAGFIIFQK